MEGTLFKWTNYYNGWQPRYFLLNEKGTLSYFKSKDLIDQGCKGSSLVVACQLKVHPHDSCRFDLIIPGEQFLCLKAKSQSERQRWLVALGTWKYRGSKANERKASTSNENDQELKIKVQELRLYETVLMQGIHQIKSLANDTPIVDIQKLDQSTSMLNVTCDAFIHTLDECVRLANGNSISRSSLIPLSLRQDQPMLPRPSPDPPTESSTSAEKEVLYSTYFSQLTSRFSGFHSMPFDRIPSELFLSTAEEHFSLFEKFPNPTFIPLRAQANGNIAKLRRKFSNDPEKFQRLAAMINDEIGAQTSREKNSATDALLWLKRDLHFLSCFLHEFGQANQTVEDAMNKAYCETLKPFHGWITRGVFSIAFRSVPYNEDFLRSLTVGPVNIHDIAFQRQIFAEMLEFSAMLASMVRLISDFYLEHHLDSTEMLG